MTVSHWREASPCLSCTDAQWSDNAIHDLLEQKTVVNYPVYSVQFVQIENHIRALFFYTNFWARQLPTPDR